MMKTTHQNTRYGMHAISISTFLMMILITLMSSACDDDTKSSMATGGSVAGESMAGESVAGESVAGETGSQELSLGNFEEWQSPIETYINEATAAIGPEVNQGIHDLFVFNDQLYIGYGDADLNAGGVSPIQIMSFASLNSQVSISSLETGEEGIYKYRLIDGELMIAGVDSTDADELTSRPLIFGNFLRTREGVWEKHRAIQGGEHVHDVTRFMEGLWAVGSGADNRMEWETYGVYRYLWFSGDGGVSWRRYKRVFREIAGDTRFVHLLAVGPRLFIFGYLNPRADDEPIVPKNEMMQGATGEPTPLITGREEGQTPEQAHPLANIFVTATYPITEELGVITGFDLIERSWRAWQVFGDGRVEVISAWEGSRVVDLSVDQESGSIIALLNDNQEGDATTGKIYFGMTLEEIKVLGLIDFIEGSRPKSIARWGDTVMVGMQSGVIAKASIIGLPE